MNDLVDQDIDTLKLDLNELLDTAMIELTKEVEIADAELIYGTTS